MKKTETTMIDKLLAQLDAEVEHLSGLVSRSELEVYLVGDNINDVMVDDDENISAESVATLGAYTEALQIRKKLRKIAGKKEEKKGYDTIIIAHDAKTGKSKRVEAKDLPKGVREAMKKLIKDAEND